MLARSRDPPSPSPSEQSRIETDTGSDGGQRYDDAEQPGLVESEADHNHEDSDIGGSHHDSQSGQK